jgi:hypothetical protein
VRRRRYDSARRRDSSQKRAQQPHWDNVKELESAITAKLTPGMSIDKIYHPAALASALAYFLLGWLWYGVLFGKQWMQYAHVSPADMNRQDPVPYIVAAAMALVLAYVTAIALSRDEERRTANGVKFGLFMGIGLVASTQLETYLFTGWSWQLWVINVGYNIVGLAIIGAIVGGWKKKSSA